MGRFNSSFDTGFNTMRNIIIGFFILFFVIFLGSMLFRGKLVYDNFSDGKPVYEIKVPDYDGGYNSYITSEYTERNGCIKFIDEFGFEQEVCDKYTVSKWK